MLRILRVLIVAILLYPAALYAQQGMVLYLKGGEIKGNIHLVKLDTNGDILSDEEIYSEQALDPKFSPDGNRIVFAKDSPRAIWVMDLDGGNQTFLANCANENYPLGSWRHENRIYFNGGASLLCYHFDTQETTVEATNDQQTFRELDISKNLRGVHGGMPPIWAFDLNEGTDEFAFDRCGGSISPEGTLLTNCHGDHMGFDLRAWGDWHIVSSISTPTQYEAINPQYSGNSDDHIVVNVRNASGKYQTWLLEISSNKWIQITDNDVANGAADFFLGLPDQAEPRMTFSPDRLSFSASANGLDPEPQTISISNSGSGTLDPIDAEVSYQGSTGWLHVVASGSDNNQELLNSVDITGLQAGTYLASVELRCANAVNSPNSYEVQLDVTPISPSLMRINCGTNSYTPDGWENDDAFVSGGHDYDFDGVWNLEAENAAPESVYQTVRHEDHDYDFPDIPNGRYTVRFHMGDGSATDSRKMDFFIEGQQVLDDFSPGLEAGTGHKALVRDFHVIVEDGDGLQIQARKDTGNDVFLCGIEILEETEPENQAPVVDAGQDQNVSIDSSALLFGTVTDDGIPGPVTVSWSEVTGAGNVVFEDANSKSTHATFSSTGRYELRLTADDGELQGFDDLVVDVTEAPVIHLQSPVGGERWKAGSVQTIQWTSIGIDDVVPYYSTDGGTTWNKIEDFIYKEDDPERWGKYPWTVPDQASDQCLVRIEEYNNPGMFAVSENTFSIIGAGLSCPEGTREQDGQCIEITDDMQGSCGCGREASFSSSILFLFGFALLLLLHRQSAKGNSGTLEH